MPCAWVLPVRSRVMHGHSPGSTQTEPRVLVLSGVTAVCVVCREQTWTGRMKGGLYNYYDSPRKFLMCEMRALCAYLICICWPEREIWQAESFAWQAQCNTWRGESRLSSRTNERTEQKESKGLLHRSLPC